MATYKSEFMSKYFRRRLRPPQAYSLGLVMLHARIARCAPRLANRVTQAPVLGDLIKRAGGIRAKRDLPPFAPETFKAWWKRRAPVNPTADPVALFPDTFGNFFCPEPMKATVEVLEDAGYRVIVPPEALCCGRPLYDYGMLDTAKGLWARVLEVLRPHVQAGTTVVGVEPSCVAAFRDELPGLLPHDEHARRLSRQTLTLGELLIAVGYEPPRLERKALVHRHCHHEAVMGTSSERQLLEAMGLGLEVLDSGCCGMAGSFGFKSAHYDLSVAIGEHRLLPMVRDEGKETLLVADGFSCRTQVEQLTDRRALHTAQVIKMAMEQGPDGPPGCYPESSYPDVIADGQPTATPARLAGAVAAGSIAVGGALAARHPARRW